MGEQPPFKAGDRIRMKAHFMPNCKRVSRTAVVLEVCPNEFYDPSESDWEEWERWCIRARRDGRRDKFRLAHTDWVLDGPRPFSESAVLLARAVLDGNLEAAFALADEVFEHSKKPPA